MHPVATAKEWSRHLHDSMLTVWHHIDQHLRSRHFWMGVGVTLLAVGFVTLLYVALRYAPMNMEIDLYGMPYYPQR